MRFLIAVSLSVLLLDMASPIPGHAFANAWFADDTDAEEPLDEALSDEEFSDREVPTDSDSAGAVAQVRRAFQYAPGATCELKFYAAGTVTMCQ
jgi:hypothetical protein